jgi:fused signal recognition particle receptor
MGMFDAFKRAIKKTRDVLNTDIRDLFRKEGRLVDEDFLDELTGLLLKTDMGVKPARKISEDVQSRFRGRVVHMEDVLAVVQENIRELLDQPEEPIHLADTAPTVILVAGVNGSGKTTSIAKLAKMFRDQGKTVVLGAGDTFRAAAVEQLTIWAGRLGCEIVTAPAGSDPASVAHRTVETAMARGADIAIIDTAGRLQTQTNLMNELSKIRRVIARQKEGAPHETLLVLDATTGQNGLSQTLKFSEAIECTGLILSKLDGTAKGGVVVAIRQQFNLPVKYVGTGESADDLEVFNAKDFAAALFSEGPVR